MKYKEYIKHIRKAESLAELTELAERARIDPDLSESERKTLLSIEIGRKRGKISEQIDIYLSDAKARIDRLLEEEKITEDFAEVLENYFLTYVPNHYTSTTTMRKNVLPYITSFIEFVWRKKNKKKPVIAIELKRKKKKEEEENKPVTAMDFDLNYLKSTDILTFLDEKSKSRATQKQVLAFIDVFLKWLFYEGYINKHAKAELKKEERKYRAKVARKLGTPRKLDELRIIFDCNSQKPSKTSWDIPIYQYFFRLLLQTGLRPAHALAIKVGDLEEIRWVEDALGRRFAELPTYDIVLREKGVIYKKTPNPYSYISAELYDTIVDYVEEQNWDEDVPICPIPMRTLQSRAKFVAQCASAKMRGLRNFSMYDFRHTWATVLFRCSGKDIVLVAEMGGWSTTQVPGDYYASVMMETEALSIAKEYEIFLPTDIEDKVAEIEEKGEAEPVSELESVVRGLRSLSKRVTAIERRLLGRRR